jgi:ribose transport system permease protein
MNNNKIAQTFLNTVKSLILPVLVFAVFAIMTRGRTVNSRIILAILRQSVVPILICWALVLNMSLGIMNFAAGGVVLCAIILAGNIAKLTYTGLGGVIMFSLLICLFLSFITGVLYNLMKIPALVLTIGLVLIFESIPRFFFRSGATIARADTILALSPYCFIVLVVMGFVFYIAYNKTAFGHNLRALGSNPALAKSAGLNPDRIKLLCFVISGLFLGVAAVLYGSNQGQVQNVIALGSMGIMIDAFMAVFLAFFLSRYCNMAFAVVIGTITMRLINNGFVSMGLSATVREITTGVFLFVLLAISANQGWIDRLKLRNENARIANEKYALNVQKKLRNEV